MAAFGTVKPGFEKAAQLQFPQQFSREYARRQLGLRYAPNDAAPVVQDYVGDDFFADYHAQKRADSQRSVLTGVADTRRSVNRAMVSHAGVYGMPEPVRSQRRIGSDVGVHIGANALYGAGISNAAPVAGLEGGVIGSREGRVWTKNALQKRIAEFDAIDAAQAEGPTVQAAIEKGIEPGELEETEASVVWQRILQAARSSEGFGTDTMALIPRAVKALTDMFSVPANLSLLDDYQYEIDDAATALRAYITNETLEDNLVQDRVGTPFFNRGLKPGTGVSARIAERANARDDEVVFNNQLIALEFLKKSLTYLSIIGDSVQKQGVPSDKDLRALSRAAAKSVKFGSIKIPSLSDTDARVIGDRTNPRRPGDTEPLSSNSSGGPSTGSRRSLGPFVATDGISFTSDGTSYEDSSGPSTVLSRAELNDYNQDIFGRQGQKGEFRGERNYFGEDTDQSSWRPGVDVIEEAPRGFTNVVRGLSTDVDYKEMDEGDAGADDESMKLSRVRQAAEELGLTSLADIEEAIDEMPAAQARAILNRIAVQLRSAYEGKATTASRDITTAKSQINQLLTAASR
jgi:hypothetical protein